MKKKISLLLLLVIIGLLGVGLTGCKKKKEIVQSINTVTYTVNFESNGGTTVSAITVESGKTITKPSNPTKEGFLLEGWYKEIGLTNRWNFTNDTVQSDMTLYAKWAEPGQMNVVFTDKNLESVVRAVIEKPEGEINEVELLNIETLEANGREITNLDGIEYIKNLRELRLNDNKVSDITKLASLSKLQYLTLENNLITEMVSLANLSELIELNLGKNKITQLPRLGNMENLEVLDLSDNELESLDMIDIPVTEIANNSKISRNIITNAPYSWGKKLGTLVLSNNKLKNEGELKNLTSINKLDISGNENLTLSSGTVSKIKNEFNIEGSKQDLAAVATNFKGITLVVSDTQHQALTDVGATNGTIKPGVIVVKEALLAAWDFDIKNSFKGAKGTNNELVTSKYDVVIEGKAKSEPTIKPLMFRYPSAPKENVAAFVRNNMELRTKDPVDFSKNFAISFWLYLKDDLNDISTIFRAKGFTVFVENDSLIIKSDKYGSIKYEKLNKNKWYNITINKGEFNGSLSDEDYSLYIDGVKKGNAGISAEKSNLYIGKYSIDESQEQNFGIDNILIYNKALEETKIKSIYSTEKEKYEFDLYSFRSVVAYETDSEHFLYGFFNISGPPKFLSTLYSFGNHQPEVKKIADTSAGPEEFQFFEYDSVNKKDAIGRNSNAYAITKFIIPYRELATDVYEYTDSKEYKGYGSSILHKDKNFVRIFKVIDEYDEISKNTSNSVFSELVAKDDKFHGKAYYDSENKELVISFQGTDGKLDSHLVTDVQLALGGVTYYHLKAKAYALSVINSFSNPDSNNFLPINQIVFTGHSLGGSAAQFAFLSALKYYDYLLFPESSPFRLVTFNTACLKIPANQAEWLDFPGGIESTEFNKFNGYIKDSGIAYNFISPIDPVTILTHNGYAKSQRKNLVDYQKSEVSNINLLSPFYFDKLRVATKAAFSLLNGFFDSTYNDPAGLSFTGGTIIGKEIPLVFADTGGVTHSLTKYMIPNLNGISKFYDFLTDNRVGGFQALTYKDVKESLWEYKTTPFTILPVETPKFSLDGGSYPNAQIVSISTNVKNAEIRYTINGDTPDETSTKYTTPISISRTTTLKAIVIKQGAKSKIVSEMYVIGVGKPVMSITSGTYSSAQTVSISTETAGAEIRYTTDGTVPDETSTIYTNPISISKITTLKAIAIKDGIKSLVANETYTINTENPTAGDLVFVEMGTAGTSGLRMTESFYIQKYEVTQAQFEAIMGYNPSEFGGKPNNPVEQVTWYDAVMYANKLSIKEGLLPYYNITGISKEGDRITGATVTENSFANGYRLPTEQQWEYAARGGNKSNNYIYAGSNNYNNVAWLREISSDETKAVGIKQANELGLYDMSGNVWEWTNSRPSSRSPDLVFRGGSWNRPASMAIVTDRLFMRPYFYLNNLGFRLVRPY